MRCDQPPLPGGDEPEHRVPVLNLAGVSGNPAPVPDDTARWLAGGALVIATVAVVTALVGRRRT